MKITLEHLAGNELEVVVRGDSASDEVRNIVEILSSSGMRKTPKMIIGKSDEKEYVLPVEEVESFYADCGAVYARYDSDEFRIMAKLFEMEGMYAGFGFRRVSKSVLLNCNFIKYLEVEFNGNYVARTSSNQEVVISRKYISSVKQYIKEEM